MVFCFGLAALTLVKTFQVQVIGDKRLSHLAKRQFDSKVLVRPRRGLILDRNGEPFAINVDAYSLAVSPKRISEKKKISQSLAKVLEIPELKIYKKINRNTEFAWIQRHVSEKQLENLKKNKMMDDNGSLVRGLWLVREEKRVYPHGDVAAHVIGDVNIDTDGIEGTELWLNSVLRGQVQSVSAIKDALGRPTFIDAVTAKLVQDGGSVQLTLDASLQFEVEKALKASIKEHRAQGGTVIVMNAVTGEILALANQPSFNPNKRSYLPSRRRNRALTDGFEPGSTMKPILMAAALKNGWKPSSLIWGGQGEFKIGEYVITEAETHEKFGWLSLTKMIQFSSNVGTAKLALKLGTQRYVEAMKVFGFGQKSGMGFPGEISGWIPNEKAKLPEITLANMGFGQGILVTPLQMIRAYASFVNGGWLVEPSLIRKPLPKKQSPPKRILSEKTARQVMAALEKVTQAEGTGIDAALEGYRVGGKTGTAQVIDPQTKRYSKSHYISSFVGFAIDVDPTFVIFTSIDKPRGVYYASKTAAPLFKKVLSATVHRFGIPRTEKILLSKETQKKKIQAHKDWSRTLDEMGISDQIKVTQAVPYLSEDAQESLSKIKGKSMSSFEKKSDGWRVPELTGFSSREVLLLLKGIPIEIKMKGFGLVSRQIPKPGKILSQGEQLKVFLKEPEEVVH